MTMFSPDTPDIEKKLREIEDEDITSIMKERGYSDKEIEKAIRKTCLYDSINRLKDILCEDEEILTILLEDGWNKEEVEAALKI